MEKKHTMYNKVGLSVDEEKHANTDTIIINEPQMINIVGNAKLNCGAISNTFPMETRIQRPNNNRMNPAILMRKKNMIIIDSWYRWIEGIFSKTEKKKFFFFETYPKDYIE